MSGLAFRVCSLVPSGTLSGRRFLRGLCGGAVGLIALVSPGALRSASAATVTTYGDASAFTNGLTDLWNNEFSGITSSGVIASPSSFSGTTTGTYAYSATANPGLYGWGPGTPGPALTTLARNTNLVFNSFSPGISGFGGRFWVTDFETGSLIPGRTVTLTLGLSNNTTASANVAVSSTATFLGLIVDPAVTITSATLSAPGDTNYITAAGQVIVGAAVPEPTALTLMLIGAGVSWIGWRRFSRGGAGRDPG
jgi:hypothetical protein